MTKHFNLDKYMVPDKDSPSGKALQCPDHSLVSDLLWAAHTLPKFAFAMWRRRHSIRDIEFLALAMKEQQRRHDAGECDCHTKRAALSEDDIKELLGDNPNARLSDIHVVDVPVSPWGEVNMEAAADLKEDKKV